MHHRLAALGLTTAAATTGLALGLAQGGAIAAPAPSATEYVATNGQQTNGNTGCSDAGFSSIQAAVDASPVGGTVVVCRGTFAESVTLTHQLTLQGRAGSVINAANQPYGVGVAADHSVVTGITVINAMASQTGPGDGIITAGLVGDTVQPASAVIITHTITRNNDGAGIDLNSTSWSEASDNVANNNGIGINISTDFGRPAAHNKVSGNTTNNNPGGCGIVLADHSGSGVHNNVISGNTANNNGLGTPSRPNASSGSGIILADPTPAGGVYNNVIESNRLAGNGHAGIALHAHAKGSKFNGNYLVDNVIGTNNKRTDYKDTATTGIYLGDVSRLTIVVGHNVIHSDKIGIFTAGPITLKYKNNNNFNGVQKRFVHINKYAG